MLPQAEEGLAFARTLNRLINALLFLVS